MILFKKKKNSHSPGSGVVEKGADTWDAVFLQNLKLSGTSIRSLFNKAFQNWPNLNQSFFSQNFGIGSKSKALKMW